MEDTLVPIVFFLMVAACILIPSYLRYKTRVRKMNTVVKLAESGGEVKAEMIKMLGQEGGPTSDMRKGVILVALSLPIIVGLLIAGEYVTAVILGGIPLCVGLAYLAVMKYGYTDESTHGHNPLG